MELDSDHSALCSGKRRRAPRFYLTLIWACANIQAIRRPFFTLKIRQYGPRPQHCPAVFQRAVSPKKLLDQPVLGRGMQRYGN